jgi:hydroxylamine dehydrogenase
MKKYLLTLATVAGGLVLTGGILALAQQARNVPKQKEFRIERSMPKEAVACIECHKREHPGIFADWAMSRHASANITCYDCHKAEEFDPDVSKEHYKQYERRDVPYGTKEYRVPVAAVVTPKDCSRCHPDESKQYSMSKHANTIEIIWKIDPWLNKGMNSDFERASGCYHCHGTVVKFKGGKLDPETWPNVGVGRINLDGSKGSCTSCHTRHRFSVMEARKPEACGQCHLGPDHPQIEIYMESKHGDIYTAHGDEYNWNAAPGTWSAGVDFRGPTCASCHISGAGTVLTSHDVTERLAWELQAPLTVRPQDFAAFPAKTNWKVEREKMKVVCQQCHGKTWVDDHFVKLDRVVEEYNEVYFKPAKKVFDDLNAKGLLDGSKFFDEALEVEFYELWHHEGRRARMGAAMMAPDYAWWHGFYECKKRYNTFMREARHLLEKNEKAYKAPDYPNATGRTTKPEEVFGKGK